VKTWTTLNTFFYVFLHDTSKKRKKLRFFGFSKNVKNVFSNYASDRATWSVLQNASCHTTCLKPCTNSQRSQWLGQSLSDSGDSA